MNIGSVLRTWIIETRKGSGESVVISHPSATWCIQLPRLEIKVASQRARKTRFWKGYQGLFLAFSVLFDVLMKIAPTLTAGPER